MAHWRSMMDPKDTLAAWELDGRDVTLTITGISQGELVDERGKRNKRPLISFQGTAKRLAANPTNCKIIAQLYGSDTGQWIGRAITIYPTTTRNANNETVDCIRVRPKQPSAKQRAGKPANTNEPTPPPAEPEMSDDEKREIERLEALEAARADVEGLHR